jgi:hypothetical protein
MRDEELLRAQRRLQDDSTAVVADLGLDTALAALGDPVRTGSSALGLMVRRDIDITTGVAELDDAAKDAIATLGARLSRHDRVRKVLFRDDTGRWNTEPDEFPDGMYLLVEYRDAAGATWSLDLWFVDQPERQPDIAHLSTLLPRITDAARVSILRIKQALDTGPEYGASIHGIDVYRAVLDHGVTTPEEFEVYRTSSSTQG